MSKPKKAGDRLLLRPSEGTQWEVRSMSNGGEGRLIETRESPGDGRISQQSVLALPVRQVFAVPLWLATTDPALMREMIFLQLERRGLAGGRSSKEVIFDYRIVATVENKTLVLAVALPGSLPGHLCLDLRSYEPSARLLPLPRDEFTLWREGGRLALAATRGEELAYFQSLGDGSFTGPVLQELRCIKLQLESANIIGGERGVTVWGDFAPGEISSLGETMGLRVAAAPKPAPVLPREPMDLMPASVRQTRRIAQTQGRNFAIAAAVAGAYLLLLFILVVRLTWFYVGSRLIERRLAAHQTEVAEIEATAARWDSLAPAIDPETYPVELLLRCSRLLPPQGVRFTSFDMNTGKITITGEAASPTAAVNFNEALKQSRDLRDYKIEMPTPVTLPNGNTTFTIIGVPYNATAH